MAKQRMQFSLPALVFFASLLLSACGGGGGGGVNTVVTPPELAETRLSVAEDAAGGTVIGTLSIVSDGGTEITAVELSGDGSAQFSIDLNGNIALAESASLDFETVDTYSLTAVAANEVGNSAPVAVTIDVSYVGVPVLALAQLSVAEGATAGTVLGKIEIVRNGGKPVTGIALTNGLIAHVTTMGSIPYVEYLDASGMFSVTPDGTVSVATDLVVDYETQTSIVMNATATNEYGEGSAVPVVVNVTNLAESVPTVNDSIIKVSTQSEAGSQLATVDVASDGGGPILSYSIGGDCPLTVDEMGRIALADDVQLPLPLGSPTCSVTVENSAGTTTASLFYTVLTASDFVQEEARVIGDHIVYGSGDTAITITQDLHLPMKTPNGLPIHWSSDRPDVIDVNGKVVRPPFSGIDQNVRLIAEVEQRPYQAAAPFDFVVLKTDTATAISQLETALEGFGINPNPGPRRDRYGNELPGDFNPLKDPRVTIYDTSELVAFTANQSMKGIYETLPDPSSGADTVSPATVLREFTSFEDWTDNIKAGVGGDFDGDGRDEVAVAYIADGGEIMLYVLDDASSGYALLFGPSNVGGAPAAGTSAGADNVGELDMTAGDIDGDGKAELVIAAGKKWWRNEGLSDINTAAPVTGMLTLLDDANAGFSELLAEPVGSASAIVGETTAVRVVAADADNDGSAEIAIVAKVAPAIFQNDNTLYLEIGKFDAASGTLQVVGKSTSAGTYIGDITSGDINGNGVAEFIMAGITYLGSTNDPTGGIRYRFRSLEFDGTGYVQISERELDDVYADDVFSVGHKDDCVFGGYYPGCSTVRVLDVFAETLDIDGDMRPELLANNAVRDANYDIKVDVDGEQMWIWDMFNAGGKDLGYKVTPLFDRSLFSVAVGDFTGDKQDDIAYISAYLDYIPVHGNRSDGDFVANDGATLALSVWSNIGEQDWKVSNNPLLASANVDGDSLILEYVKSETVFTEPVPLAAVAAAPCWNAVWQNTEECTSSYGDGTSVATASEDSYTLEASISAGGKGTVGPAEIEAKVTVSGYYEWAFGSEHAVTKSVAYTSGSHEDIVVFYSVPYDVYVYNVLASPRADEVGTQMEVRVPRKPVTRQAELSYYNQGVSLYNPDRVIGSETFSHTAGDPSTYPTAEDKKSLLASYGGEQSAQAIGVPQGTGNTELAIEVSDSSSFRESLGFSVTAEVQFSAKETGPLGAVSFGSGYGHDVTTTTTNFSTYGVSVGGIDAANFSGNNYSFGMFAYPFDHPSGFTFHVVNFWTVF